jgi:cytochrome P450
VSLLFIRVSDSFRLTLKSRSLITGATDTTASTLSRILWLLAEHQDVQHKLREELTMAREIMEKIDYDHLQSLSYLEAVCRETLRLYVSLVQAQVYKR